MIIKCISIALVLLLAAAAACIALAQADDDTKHVQTIKEKIGKAAAGTKTTVSVMTRDGAKFKGRITSVADASFALLDQKSKLESSIAYADVKSVSTAKGLPRLAKIGIGIAIGIGALFAICYGGDQGCGYG